MTIHDYKYDIHHITCSVKEIPEALKALDKNLSQCWRIIITVEGKDVYIYHSTIGGLKRVSDKNMDYDKAMSYACEYGNKTRSFTKLNLKAWL